MKKVIMDTSKYPNLLAEMIIDNGGIGKCRPVDKGKYEQIMPIKSIDTIKLKKLHKYPLNRVLHEYFDTYKQLKKKYLVYQYELVWYCFEKNVIVFADGSGKCFYLEPEICK